MRSCRDLAVTIPDSNGLTIGEALTTSQTQEGVFWKCNKRLEELANVVERRRH